MPIKKRENIYDFYVILFVCYCFDVKRKLTVFGRELENMREC